MDINLTKEEIEMLDKADNEIAVRGKTSIKCPRCGNEIIVVDFGKSYTIKCKTDNCISMCCRGI